MAREIIDENHPLNNTPFYVTYPIFAPFARLMGRDGQREASNNLNEPLLEDLPTNAQ